MRLLYSLLVLGVAAPLQADDSFAPVRSFLDRHCVDCHQGEDAESKVRLDQISPQLAAGNDAEVWERVLNQLASGEMPPKEQERPKSDELSAAKQWIHKNLHTAAVRLAEKQPPVRTTRRLNRNEYSNTIRDLFGIEFEAGKGFPQDDSAHGFDNVGEALTLSPLLLEKYLFEAERITQQVILAERAEPLRGKWTGNELVYHKARNIREGDAVRFYMVGHSNGGGAFKPYPVPFKRDGYITPAAGRYRVRVKAHPIGPLVPVNNRWRIVYKPEEFEHNPKGCESPRLLIVCNGEFAGRVTLEDREPKVYEFTTWAEAGKKFAFTVENGVGGIRGEFYTKYTGPGVVVHSMEIEGPIYDSWPTPAYKSLFFGGEDAKPTRDYAREILSRFAGRAYRRPVTDAEVAELLKIFDDERSREASFDESIAVAVQRALCSPHFLFLAEPSESKPGKLTAHELATRLSYFLWSSMPDEALFAAANDGSLLANPEPHVRRMLKDPKAKTFVSNFAGQWLRLRHVQNIAVDRALYPDFTDYLRSLFVDETEAFLWEILDKDLSLLNCIDSDFAMVNDRLAEHYGIPNVVGSRFRKVALPKDSHRGGLMTQGSVLLLTTCGTRTSPILRGTWVMESLLGLPVPPPPKDVPELPAAPRGRVSQRARLEAHRSVQACAKCHDRIDPLGFPLEHYDVIGRWRDDYGIHTRYGKNGGPPVDAKTAFTSGEQITGPDEFRRLILETRRDLFCRGFVEKLLTYALGRGLTLADRPTVDALVENLKQNNYRLADLMVALVNSKPFQNP